MGAKTKIDWCDSTWNPVTGCLHGCEYCYARRIAERFGAREIYDPECQCQRHLIERGMLTGTGKPLELDYPWEQKNKDGSITNAARVIPTTVTGWTNRSAGKSPAPSLCAAWLTCSAIGCQMSGLQKS